MGFEAQLQCHLLCKEAPRVRPQAPSMHSAQPLDTKTAGHLPPGAANPACIHMSDNGS